MSWGRGSTQSIGRTSNLGVSHWKHLGGDVWLVGRIPRQQCTWNTGASVPKWKWGAVGGWARRVRDRLKVETRSHGGPWS
eukprot:scaffold15248_cov115-Isochrysis_galbana.AAC.3